MTEGEVQASLCRVIKMRASKCGWPMLRLVAALWLPNITTWAGQSFASIEVGVLLDDKHFATQLAQQWMSLIEAELCALLPRSRALKRTQRCALTQSAPTCRSVSSPHGPAQEAAVRESSSLHGVGRAERRTSAATRGARLIRKLVDSPRQRLGAAAATES